MDVPLMEQRDAIHCKVWLRYQWIPDQVRDDDVFLFSQPGILNSRHSGAGRNLFVSLAPFAMDPGLRRDDEVVGVLLLGL